MKEKEKLLTEEELVREGNIYEQISLLKSGANVRRYLREHKDDVKKYNIKISFLRKYPYLPLALSIIALVLSVVRLLY